MPYFLLYIYMCFFIEFVSEKEKELSQKANFRKFYNIIRSMLYALVFVFVVQNAMGATSCDRGQYAVEMQTPILGGGGGFVNQTVCLNCPEGSFCVGGTRDKESCSKGYPNSAAKSGYNTDCYSVISTNLNYGQLTQNQTFATIHYPNTNTAVSCANGTMMCVNGSFKITTLPSSPSRTGYTFAGWYPKSDGTGTKLTTDVWWTPGVGAMNFDWDFTFYAKWTANKYTISFDANGGSGDMSSQSVTYGTTGNKLKSNAFTKDGYTFVGWCKGGTSCTTPTYQDGASVNNITSSMKLYAMWKPNTYTVKYYANGASGTSPYSVSATYDVSGTHPESTIFTAPVGYKFMGWCPGESGDPCSWAERRFGGNSFLNLTATNGGVVKYRAIWVENSYDIIYLYPRDNGSSCINDGQRYNGWCGMYTRQPLLPNSYTINSATISLPTESDVDAWFVVNNGSGLDSIPYSFGGWYEMTNESSLPCIASGSSSMCSGTSVTQFTPDTNNLANRVFMSKWTPKIYTITLDPNGGSGGTSVLYTKYGVGVYLDAYLDYQMSTSANPITPPTTKPQISVTYKDDDGTTVLSQVPYDLTFDGYEAKYMMINSDGYITADGLYYGQTARNDIWPAVWTCASVTLPTPANKPGYNFMGWYDGTGANATKIGDAGSTTLCLSENQTMYAKWEVIRYTIIYDTNGGTLAAGINNPANYTVGSQPIALPNDSDITKTGHTFDGWCVYDLEQTPAVTTCNAPVLMNELAAGVTGNKWAYAKWKPQIYTITLDPNGGSGGTSVLYTKYGVGVYLDAYLDYQMSTSANPITPPTTKPQISVTYKDDDGTTVLSQVPYDLTFDGYEVKSMMINSDGYITTIGLNDGKNAQNEVWKAKWGCVNATLQRSVSKRGYSLVGWCDGFNTNANCTNDFDIVYCISENQTVYANWTPETYTITYYNTTGASFTTANPSEYTIEDTVTLTNPTKTGYNFAGWCSGSTTCNNPSLSVSFSSETGNKKYYANWTPKQYEVTYKCDGAVSTVDRATYGVDYSVLNSATVCAKDGYVPTVFECSKTISGGVWNIDSDVICSATRTGNTIALGWANDEDGEVVLSGSCTYGSRFDMPDALTKSGWIFDKWNVNNNKFDAGAQGVDCNYTNLGVYSGSATITANWTPETYTITYYNTTGASFTTANPSEYTIEDTVTLTNPTKTGYNFAGWCSGSTTCNNPSLSVSFSSETGNKKYYANWTPETYTITYNTNGGTINTAGISVQFENQVYTQQYTVESSSIELVSPEKNYYTFDGWYENQNFSGNSVSMVNPGVSAEKDHRNIPLYAKWSATPYTIKYYDVLNYYNSGAIEEPAERNDISPSTYTIEEEVVFKEPALPQDSKDLKWVFGGWYNNADLTGTVVMSITTGSNGHKSVYAKWTAKTGEVDFVCKSGTIVKKKDQVGKFIPVATSAECGDGAAVGGWSCSGYPEFSVDRTQVRVPDGKTICRTGYNITYTGKGITNNVMDKTDVRLIPDTYTSDLEVVFPSKNFMNDFNLFPGYSFTGWFFNSNFTNATTGIALGSSGDKTVYARWVPNVYRVTYNCNSTTNGSVTPVPENITYDENFTAANDVCVKKGYTFGGWIVSGTEPEHIKSAGEKFKWEYAENKTFTAKWNPIAYSVKFDSNGATGSMDNQSFVYNRAQALTKNQFSKDNYRFTGWCDAWNNGTDSCDGNMYSDEQVVLGLTSENGKVITLYAMWTLEDYSITYNVLKNGDNTWKTKSGLTPATYTIETEGELPNSIDNTTRVGYRFMGWCTDDSYLDTNCEVVSLEQLQANPKNVTLYAKWELEKYNIKYYVYYFDGASWQSVNLPSKEYNIESGTITLATPTEQDGYVFKGWCTSSARIYPKCTAMTKFTPTTDNIGDLDLYAKWGYRINYVLNGGLGDETGVYEYGFGLDELPTPIRDGWNFAGWYRDEEFSGDRVESISGTEWGPITLYAKWGFNCASGKWLHVGSGENDKMCLNNTKPDGKALGVMVGNVPYYVRLSERGYNTKTINSNSTTKLHVQIGEIVYNAHDASVE